ncbi:MAG: hypothetical protein D6800_09305 [Candidatus Zixiibacteriota bacterium]|nr:MAG: hypothetical protein D6800_09305 [candidate division Zixibacteria bacterium]
MRNHVATLLAHLLAAVLLCSCGTASPSSPIVANHAPPADTSDVPNSLDIIIEDMTLPHEGIPHGVPPAYDWARGPVSNSQSIPTRFHAMVAWGQVYEDTGGNPATNTRVQIRDIHAYLLSKKDNRWHQLQYSRRVTGAAYLESFVPPTSKPADIRYEPDGSISVTAGGGYNFHFWTPTRAAIDPTDVAGIFTTAEARLIVDDSTLPDDRTRARYLMSMGGDLWRDTTVDYTTDADNPDIGMGRFKYVTPAWRSYNMLYMEGGLDVNRLRRNPPPITAGRQQHGTPDSNTPKAP